MKNQMRNEMWQELTAAEAVECVGGIVTTGPVKTLDLLQVPANGPIGSRSSLTLSVTAPLG